MHADHFYIDGLRSNNPAIIRQIYAQFARQAHIWITQRGGSVDDARDVFQEAVIAVFEKANDPAFELTCPLGALLHIIYSRKWIDRHRQKNRESAVRNEEALRYKDESSADALSLAEEALEEADRQTRLGKAFGQLTETCRRLLQLLSEGVKPAEIVIKMDFNSVDTLYRRKNACMERWRALLEEMP